MEDWWMNLDSMDVAFFDKICEEASPSEVLVSNALTLLSSKGDSRELKVEEDEGHEGEEVDFNQVNIWKEEGELIEEDENTGEKRTFKCELCPRKYSKEDCLQDHIRIHHSPLDCAKCGSVLLDRQTFLLHRKVYIFNESFKCDLCSYASCSHCVLRSHIMRFHTDSKQRK